MNGTAQTIVAVGVAGLLLMLGIVAIIWSIRCAPRMPHYRLPALIAVSIPISLSVIWALEKLS